MKRLSYNYYLQAYIKWLGDRPDTADNRYYFDSIMRGRAMQNAYEDMTKEPNRFNPFYDLLDEGLMGMDEIPDWEMLGAMQDDPEIENDRSHLHRNQSDFPGALDVDPEEEYNPLNVDKMRGTKVGNKRLIRRIAYEFEEFMKKIMNGEKLDPEDEKLLRQKLNLPGEDLIGKILYYEHGGPLGNLNSYWVEIKGLRYAKYSSPEKAFYVCDDYYIPPRMKRYRNFSYGVNISIEGILNDLKSERAIIVPEVGYISEFQIIKEDTGED